LAIPEDKPGSSSRVIVNPSVGRPPFYLTGTQAQEIVVFDALGEKVTSLKANELWDGNNQRGATVKPGVYLLCLKSAGPSSATKLIITR